MPNPPPAGAARGLAAELAPRRLLPALAAALAVGPIVVIVAISFAALVFSGPLAAYTGAGVGLALGGAAAVAVVVALGSSFRGMVATPQDTTAAVVALIAAAAAAAAAPGGGAAPRSALLTVAAAVALTTVLAGVCFYLLGRFRLGGLVRYLPYPVIGGFLAGTGWLLVRGALGVMADRPVGLRALGDLLEPAVAIRWLPGALFALALLVVLRRVKHYLALPAMVLGSIALFYLALAATGTSLERARQLGLLLGPVPERALWRPLVFEALAGADWGVVAGQLPTVGPVVVIGVVALLLNATGLEIALKRDVDLDRELSAAGVANLIAGALGGLPGFQTLSLSSLGHRMAPDSRLVGLLCGGLCAATLFAGGSLLALLPKASVGGLLLFLGLAFLVEWVIDARRSLPRVDYLVVLFILVLVATVGFLESVGAGVVVAVALFVVNYSRVDVVRWQLDAATHPSNVDRPREQVEALRARGAAILLLKLQGYLFFGTANGLLERVKRRLDDPGPPPLAWAIADFALVSGIDSSAVLSFVKLRQLAAARGFGLVATALSPQVREQLARGGFLGAGGEIHEFGELDRGLQWCEDRLLIAASVAVEAAPMTIRERLERIFRDPAAVERLLGYFERQEVAAGTVLMRRGDPPADGMFVVESGQVSAQLEIEGGEALRLRTMGPGSVLGEIELYLETPRAASVVAETPCVIWRISAAALLHLKEADPTIAARFHFYMCRILAGRLAKNHELLRTLLK